MAKRNDTVLYDLIPSQNAMYYMFKFSLHKNVMQIPTSIKADRELDIEALKKAFAIEVQRNDCMRLRFTLTANGIKQHFLPSAPVKEIPVVSFSSDEEEEAYLTADAQKSVRFLRGETFRFIIFNDKDGNTFFETTGDY